MKTVDVFIKKQGYHSRNEFFEKAAKNLIADSALKSSDDILSDKLAKAIENVSAENAKAISNGLFRYSVQLEMMMRVIAKTNHFTDDDLEDVRREAVNNVRRTRGKIKLEDIAKGWYNEEHGPVSPGVAPCAICYEKTRKYPSKLYARCWAFVAICKRKTARSLHC